ncbi:MAG: hypothetical protein HQM09_10325 [Candidatus Riflebacteria bacterium]|nr:hypothetical protein [Candidatus Riflebacteria bacterium]
MQMNVHEKARRSIRCFVSGKLRSGAGLCAVLFLFTLSPVSGREWQSGLAVRQISQWLGWSESLGNIGAISSDRTQTFQELARIWAKSAFGEARFQFEVENRCNWKSSAGKTGWDESQSESQLRWWSLDRSHTRQQREEASSEIERLDVSWRSGSWSFDVGRQPISLGTSHYVDILDVLAPFHPGYMDSSYKPGIDALRFRRGSGTAGECEVIAVPTQPWQNRALLGRWRENVRGFDFELVGGEFRDRGFIGLGYDGEIRKTTCWGEIASFQRKPSKEVQRSGGGDQALSWIAGLEREVHHHLRMGVAYLSQDFGTSKASLLPAVATDAPYAEGWTFLSGSRYAVITTKKEFTPLIRGDINGLVNLNDGSKLWQPVVTVSLGNNSDIAFFGWISNGQNLSMHGVTRSEFGVFPSGGGFILRWFR